MLSKWDKLPDSLKNDEVLYYYNILKSKKAQLIIKRIFDILLSVIFIIAFSWLYLFLGVLIAVDSGFPVLYLQNRITKNSKTFRIFKFRTMVKNADKIGSLVTVDNDSRITKIGKFLRKLRLDELPQIFNILIGDMSFVGTRPEVKKYVDAYSKEMLATLLLPAGVTSTASIEYKDEAEHLNYAADTDKTYIETILPEKMKYNLEYIKNFNIKNDLLIIFKTVFAVFK